MEEKTQVRYRKGYSKADCHVTVDQVMLGPGGRTYWIVVRAEEPINTDDGQKPWSQEYESRRCTPAESRAAKRRFRAATLRHELRGLSGPPDDERDRPRIEARRAAIEAELAELVEKENEV